MTKAQLKKSIDKEIRAMRGRITNIVKNRIADQIIDDLGDETGDIAGIARVVAKRSALDCFDSGDQCNLVRDNQISQRKTIDRAETIGIAKNKSRLREGDVLTLVGVINCIIAQQSIFWLFCNFAADIANLPLSFGAV